MGLLEAEERERTRLRAVEDRRVSSHLLLRPPQLEVHCPGAVPGRRPLRCPGDSPMSENSLSRYEAMRSTVPRNRATIQMMLRLVLAATWMSARFRLGLLLFSAIAHTVAAARKTSWHDGPRL